MNGKPPPFRLSLVTCGYARFACSRFGRKYCGQCGFRHISAACRAVHAALADPEGLGWAFSPGGTGFCVRIENIDEYIEYGNNNKTE